MVNGNILELVSKWKFNETLHMLNILKIVEIARKLHSVNAGENICYFTYCEMPLDKR